MRKLLAIVLLLTLSFGCSHAEKNLVSKRQKNTIATTIENLINNADPHVNIGVKITAVANNETIFEKNPHRLFMPASTIKLVTLAAALHYLGPYKRFETKVFTDEFDSKTKTVKNIYLKGSGDPSLMDYDLANLALELKQMGIKKVNGEIYFDDTIFDDMLWVRGAMWDDRVKGFSAPVSGLNLNYNRVDIKIVPAYEVAHPAHVLVRPSLSLFKIKAEAITKEANFGRLLTLSFEHPDQRKEEWPSDNLEGLKPGDTIVVSGQTPLNAGPYYSSIAVHNPSLMAASYFKEQLIAMGIKVSGALSRAATPEKALLLATFLSRPLSEALIDFTKISNNVANDSLIKAIAAADGVKPATASAGLKLVNDFLAKEVGIASGTLVTADGAGVSRYSLMSPDQLIRVLNYAAHRFTLSPEFMSALPIAGHDGLLSWRMRNHYQKANVRAKTGSMTGISCLAGYFVDEAGERFAFSIMINGFAGNSQKYTKLQDDILAVMMTPKDAAVVKK